MTRCICDLCGASLSKKKSIARHMMNIHLPKTAYICEHCDYRTANIYLFESHHLKHNNIRDFECKICAKFFVTTKTLRNHIQKVHENKGKGVEHPCDICQKIYHSKFTLSEHKLKEHSEKEPEYLCHLCSGKYYTNFSLKQHIFMHSTSSFPCKFAGCDRIFSLKMSMMTHYRVKHCTDTPWKCDQCDASYKLPGYLKVHKEAIHLGHRFRCVYPGCFSMFSYKKKGFEHLSKHNLKPEELKSYKLKFKNTPPIVLKDKELMI